MSFLAALLGHAPSFRSVLFVIRKPHADSPYSSYNHFSSGLANSACFVRDMLLRRGVRAHLVEVTDANDIDREVAALNPDLVILEAIWCPPAKLVELTGLHHHRHRHFVVRNHSELPFLSMEGIALEWLLAYAVIPRVHVSCNSPVAAREIEALTGRPTILLPNYYPVAELAGHRGPRGSALDIGCFGAIRPLKNHLEQAVAAVLYARELGCDLRFHINATRIEGRADPVLKSIRALFAHAPRTTLVEHGWLTHHEFTRLCARMDLGLQVSFSETFNIVAADLVSAGVPVVCSSEIPWCPEEYTALPNDTFDIAGRMRYAHRHGAGPQREALREYAEEAERLWLKWLAR